MALGRGRVFTPRPRLVCFGRIATKHARSLHYRLWLQAAVRRIAIYVGFTLSTGLSGSGKGLCLRTSAVGADRRIVIYVGLTPSSGNTTR